MSTAYRAGLAAFANKEIDWDTDDIRVILISPDYTLDADAHEDLADIVAGDRYGAGPEAAVNLAGRAISTVAGVIVELDATLTTFPSVALHEAQNVVAIVGYFHTGVESTSTLLFHDSLSAPVTPDGNNIDYTPAATGCIKFDG